MESIFFFYITQLRIVALLSVMLVGYANNELKKKKLQRPPDFQKRCRQTIKLI